MVKEVRLENLSLALPFRADDEYAASLEVSREDIAVLVDSKSHHARVFVTPDYRLLPFGGDLHDLRPGALALAEQEISIGIEYRTFRCMARTGLLKLDPWLGNHCGQPCDIRRKGKIMDAWPFCYQIRIDTHFFPFHGFA